MIDTAERSESTSRASAGLSSSTALSADPAGFRSLTQNIVDGAFRRHMPSWATAIRVDLGASPVHVYLQTDKAPSARLHLLLYAELRRQWGDELRLTCHWPQGSRVLPNESGRIRESGVQPVAVRTPRFNYYDMLYREIVETLPAGAELWRMNLYEFPVGRTDNRIAELRVIGTNGQNPDLRSWTRSIEERFQIIVALYQDRISPRVQIQLEQLVDFDGLIRNPALLDNKIRAMHGPTPSVDLHEAGERARTANRRDLSSLSFLSMDPEGTLDIDDAHHAEKLDNGSIRVRVAYADVSDLVRPDTDLYQYARNSVRSTYGRYTTLPLLGNDVACLHASLRHGFRRPVWISEFVVEVSGAISSTSFYRAEIINSRQMSYSDALSVRQNVGDPHGEVLRRLTEASKLLRDGRRMKSIDDTLEFGGKGRMENVVAECAIMAKRIAADFCAQHRIPVIYRVHAEPTRQQRRLLTGAAQALGIQAKVNDFTDPQRFLSLLSRLRDAGQESLEREIFDAYLGRARYDTLNSGHRGLRLPAYMTMSALRDFPASVNQLQMDAVMRGETPLSSRELRSVKQRVNRKDRVFLENTRQLLTFERIREGLKLSGLDFQATVLELRPRAALVSIDSRQISGLHTHIFEERPQLVLDPDSTLTVGQSVRLRLEGYGASSRHFYFNLQ